MTAKKCLKKRDPGGVLPYMGFIDMCAVMGMVFKQFTLGSWDRVYKSESLGLEEGIFFHLN